MKKIIIVSLFSILYLYSNCQTYFKKYYSIENNYTYSLAETTQDHIILAGQSRNDVFDNPYLLLLNSNGQILNERVDTCSADSYYFQIHQIDGESNRFLLINSLLSKPFNSMIIWETDDLFQISKRMEVPFNDSFTHCSEQSILINDSLIYSLLSKSTPGKTDFSLAKVNLSDSTILIYDSDSAMFRWPTSLILDSSHNKIKISCYGNDIRSEPANKIFTFDLDLNYISTYIHNAQVTGQLWIENVNENSFLGCATYWKDFNQQELTVLKFDFNNSLIDSTILPHGFDTINYPGAGKNILVTDSCIWIVGNYNLDPATMPFSPYPTWIQLNKLNLELELISQHYYGGDGAYTPYDIKKSNDNGILITGVYFNPNAVPLLYQMDPFLLKTNSEGIVVSSNENDPPITQEAIVLPNPGTDYLQVKLAVQHKSALLQLFDINGQLVIEKPINDSMERIDVSFLINGTYVYRITANNKLIGSGKWIKA